MTAITQAIKFGLTICSTVILARLLSPHDFGLVAEVTAVTGFLAIVNDGGLATATVQRERIEHGQVSNLFWANCGIGAVLSLLAAVLSPAVSRLYGDPRLVPITLALSLTFLISAVGLQHMALLRRRMQFGVIGVIEVSATAASLLVGVSMALTGCAYWSLVGSILTQALSASLLTWLLTGWTPAFPARQAGTRAMLQFGGTLLASSVVFCLARRLDSILIGRYYGSSAVGLYNRAGALLLHPLEQLLAPVTSVMIPTLSRLHGQRAKYQYAFLSVYEIIALVTFPLTAMLCGLSNCIIVVLLGAQWAPAGAIFGSFAVLALYAPLGMAANWLLISQGRGGDLLTANSVLAALTVVSFVLAIPFGVTAVALSYALSGVLVRLPVLFYFVGRTGPVNAGDLWRVLFRHLPLWTGVFVVTKVSVGYTSAYCPVTQLFVGTLLAAAVSVLTIIGVGSYRRVAQTMVDTVAGVLHEKHHLPPRQAGGACEKGTPDVR